MQSQPVDPGKRRRRGGPKTPEGKRRSSLNALKHGRYARSFFVLRHEDQAAFDHLVGVITRALLPQTDFEYYLVRQLAAIEWRLHRVLALDSSLLDTEFAATAAAFDQHGVTAAPEVQLGAAAHKLLESSPLPYYLATRESQLINARAQILAAFRQIRRQSASAPPCPRFAAPLDLSAQPPSPDAPGPSHPPEPPPAAANPSPPGGAVPESTQPVENRPPNRPSSFHNEPGTNPSQSPPQPPRNTPLVSEPPLPEAA